MRARQVANKPIEDQLTFENIEFSLLDGREIQTTLIVSNDGNQKHYCSKFYSENACRIFREKLQNLINCSGQETIDSLIPLALAQTNFQLENDWHTHVVQHIEEMSATTTNLVFLYNDTLGRTKGAFLGHGDTRTILLKTNGDVLRIGPKSDNVTVGLFTPEEQDRILISSDGIWHSASPSQVNQFVLARIAHYLTAGLQEAVALEQALLDLVKAGLPGREDDRNPFIISLR